MKIIISPPCDSYGDIFSIIGMIYYLKQHYKEVTVLLQQPKMIQYYNNYFSECSYYNISIFLLSLEEIYNKLNTCLYDEYHICDLHTGDWNGPSKLLYNFKNINKQHYFNCANPIYNFLSIPEQYISHPNIIMPVKEKEINHIVYYKFVGLNNNVRMDFFKYVRNMEIEKKISNQIKNKFNISYNEKYNVIYNPLSNINTNTLIKNSYKTINIHYLVDFPGWLCTLIENAEHIYLIEGNIVNFIYHCQYKNIIMKNPVYFYTNIRKRHWSSYNLDYAYKMMTMPILDNWILQ
jgi:hypothetical protein